MAVLRSSGTSASGTPATQVAEVVATGSNVLTGWSVFAGHASAVNTQVRVIVTYADLTTTNIDTGAATGAGLYVNAGGGVRVVGTAPNAVTDLSTKDVIKLRIETLGSGTGTRRGTISAQEGAAGAVTVKRVSGSSASGTAATTVAEIVADAGSRLVGWSAFAGQTNAANTQVRIIITYADSTTTTSDTVAATSALNSANAGGAIRMAGGVVNQVTAFSTKDVTAVRIETLGTGTGTRYGAISALHESIAVNASATPAVVAATAGVAAPTVQGGGIGSPAAVAAVSAVATPTAQGGGRASPSVVAGVGAVATPTAQGGGRASPAVVAAISAVPTPSADGTGDPLSAPLIDSGTAGGGSATLVTGTIQPMANVPVFLWVSTTDTVFQPEAPSTISGCGITWTTVGFVVRPGEDLGLALLKGIGASPQSDVVTVTYPHVQDSFAWATFNILEAANEPVVQVASETDAGATALSVTFGSAFSNSLNGAMAAIFVPGGTDVEPGTGYAELIEIGGMQIQFRADADPDPNADWSWTGSAIAIGMAVELHWIGAREDASTNPSIVSAIASVPTPSAQGGARALPSVVVATTAVSAPTAQGGGIATPTVVLAATAVPTPAVQGSGVAQPGVVAAQATVDVPVARGAGVASPAVVAAVASVLTPVVSVGGAAFPATVAAIVSVLTPTVRGDANVFPLSVVAVAGVQAPNAGGSGQAAPGTVAGFVVVPAPIVIGSAAATVATVQAIAQVLAPAVSGDAVANPQTVAAIADVLTAVGVGTHPSTTIIVSVGQYDPEIEAAGVIGSQIIDMRSGLYDPEVEGAGTVRIG